MLFKALTAAELYEFVIPISDVTYREIKSICGSFSRQEVCKRKCNAHHSDNDSIQSSERACH